eukprot:7656752-Pyramimonas_sp.AAC.1
MHVHNMLVGSCGKSLSDYAVKYNPDGTPAACPYTWPHLNLACDQGPDNVCMDGFLANKVKLNIDIDWDVSHALNNASKGALRRAG